VAFALVILQFKNFVKVSSFADGENWFLVEDLHYEIRDTGKIVIVPKGFVTDFASIPRPFWSIVPTWGKYGPPAVVHDYPLLGPALYARSGRQDFPRRDGGI
jgi:hypothetical protein